MATSRKKKTHDRSGTVVPTTTSDGDDEFLNNSAFVFSVGDKRASRTSGLMLLLYLLVNCLRVV